MLLALELEGRVAAEHGRYMPDRGSECPVQAGCLPPHAPLRRAEAMKESILDVLLYLFEHYFTNDAVSVDGDDPPPRTAR